MGGRCPRRATPSASAASACSTWICWNRLGSSIQPSVARAGATLGSCSSLEFRPFRMPRVWGPCPTMVSRFGTQTATARPCQVTHGPRSRMRRHRSNLLAHGTTTCLGLAFGSGLATLPFFRITKMQHRNMVSHAGECDQLSSKIHKKACDSGILSIQYLEHGEADWASCKSVSGTMSLAIEIIDTCGAGNYSCGAAAQPSWRAGWDASQDCQCDNSQGVYNCQGFIPNNR